MTKVTPSMLDFIRPPDTKARFIFLLALRVGKPVFWETLHAGVWKAQTPEALLWWATKWGVVDEWLMGVVRDTLEYWESEPESSDATLNPAYKWFLYRPVMQGEPKPFQLVLENPMPIMGELAIPLKEWGQLLPASFVHPSVPNARHVEVAAALESLHKESLQEFMDRVTHAFEAQLREYEKDFNRRFTFETDPETAKHATWTAARFCGAGYMQIAEQWPGLLRGIRKDPEQPDKTVNMAVRRFAERIGLTLAKRK